MANWSEFSLFILVKKSLTSLNFCLEGGGGGGERVPQKLGVDIRLLLVSRTNIKKKSPECNLFGERSCLNFFPVILCAGDVISGFLSRG